MSEIGSDQSADALGRLWEALCRTGAIKLFLFAAIVVNLFHASAARSERQNQQDFAHYYASSLLWLEGEDVYRTDLGKVYQRLGWEEFDEEIKQATNPPMLVAIFAPFAKLSPQLSHITWMLVQLFSLVAAIWLTWNCLRRSISFDSFAFVLSIFLMMPFVFSHLFYSQVQLLILAMVLGAYVLTIASERKDSKGVRAGSLIACVIVAIASLTKVFPVVLLPWFVWRSHKSIPLRLLAGVITAATLIIGVHLLGYDLWIDFTNKGLPTVSTWIKASYECFTFGNAIHQFAVGFGGDIQSDQYIRIGAVLGAIVLALFYLWLIFFGTDSEDAKHIEFALLIVLMLFCGGTCWWHYLVFLLFPMQVASAHIKRQPTMPILCFSALIVLLLANIQLPTTNSDTLNTVLNQRPLIGMILMASFLAWKLNRIAHSGSQNVKMESPTVS